MYYFDENKYHSLKHERKIFMNKFSSIILSITLCFCVFVTGCNNNNSNGELSSNTSLLTPNHETVKIPDKNIMVNYYDMTIQDVIDILGEDYVLNDYLLDAAFASIYYENNDCPFVFFYRSYTDFAPTTCDTAEKITGIKVKNFTRTYENVYVTQDIPITASYEFVSDKLYGEYYPDEMNGGNTFECTSLENVDVVWFNWSEKTGDISKILIHFKNVHDIDWDKNNSSNETESTISNSTSSQNTSNESQTTITKPVENTKKETEIFSDIFRTDYIYAQYKYCSDGRYIYTSLGKHDFYIHDTLTQNTEKFELNLASYSFINFTLFNGYVTAGLENHNVGCPDSIFTYNIATKEIKIIHDTVPIESAFIYDGYIYIKYGSEYTIGGLIQRSPINTNERKWETIVEGIYNEYSLCGNYVFGNCGDSKQMYRLDLSNGTVVKYNNGIILEKFGFLQNNNWINTNQGIFDVSANSIKYKNKNYYIYGNTGVYFKTGKNIKELEIEFFNLKSGEKIIKSYSLDEMLPFVPESQYIAIKGCTYNGIYSNNLFLEFTNENGVIGFKKHIGPKDYSKYFGNDNPYGCLFVLNNYYYCVDRGTYKAPLSDINNCSGLS